MKYPRVYEVKCTLQGTAHNLLFEKVLAMYMVPVQHFDEESNTFTIHVTYQMLRSIEHLSRYKNIVFTKDRFRGTAIITEGRDRLHLQEKGIYLIPEYNPMTRTYYCEPKRISNNEAFINYNFKASTLEEVQKSFLEAVELIDELDCFDEKDTAWEKSSDKETIEAVFNILPHEFLKRIRSRHYDPKLIKNTPGGYYNVPLYYVTKAWDYILKGELGGFCFKVGVDFATGKDYEHTQEYDEWYGGPFERTLKEAIAQNDEMKKLWKNWFSIEIDKLDIDFSKFDRRLPPNFNEVLSDAYFHCPPYGIAEGILGEINRPSSNQCTFDDVSNLMEFCAYLMRERKRWAEEE